MHLLEASLWIVMAYMVATLDISKAKDEYGNIIEPEIVFDNAVFRYVPSSDGSVFTVVTL